MEAWQVTSFLSHSTKSWGSILDVMLVAQGFVLLGTLDTQIHSGSTRPFLLNKEKPPNVAICRHRECRPWPVKLGQLVSGKLRIHTKFNPIHSVFRVFHTKLDSTQSAFKVLQIKVNPTHFCVQSAPPQGQPHSPMYTESSIPSPIPFTYSPIHPLTHHGLSTHGQGTHSESSTELGEAVASTAIT